MGKSETNIARMLSIGKYRVARCDLRTMLDNVDGFLRLLTIRVDTANAKRIPTICYVATAVSAACYFYVYLVSMVVFVYRCSLTGDMLPALIVFSLGISSEIGSVKLCCMICYQKTLQQIVTKCLASDALVSPGSRFSVNLMKTLRGVKKRAIVFWLVIIGNGVVYILKPIFMPGRHLMEDIFVIYGLEPMFESPNYEIAFIVMAVGVFVTVYLPANITAFLIIISGYIEAQMLAWSEELLHMWDDAQKHYRHTEHSSDTNKLAEFKSNMTLEDGMRYNHDKLSNAFDTIDSNKVSWPMKNREVDFTDGKKNVAINEYVRQRLTSIIATHARNVTTLRQVEDVFRTAIAVEFFLLVVGLIAELLGGLENTYMEIPYALMQVAMDCLTGQRVMDASTQFEQAVYCCRWEHLDRHNMRLVLLMLQNSQRTMTLTAGGVTTLSFCSLMAVIKSIYSAYTTLRSTVK